MGTSGSGTGSSGLTGRASSGLRGRGSSGLGGRGSSATGGSEIAKPTHTRNNTIGNAPKYNLGQDPP